MSTSGPRRSVTLLATRMMLYVAFPSLYVQPPHQTRRTHPSLLVLQLERP